MKKQLLCGVALNDSPSPIKWREDGKQRNDRVFACWRDMIFRCYSPATQAKKPAYIGCTVAPGWLRFMAFREWYERQPEQDDCQIDKDILVPGNRVYGPDTCALVSRALNVFCAESIGRQAIKKGSFVQQCRNPFTGKKEYVGSFRDRHLALLAWKARKHKHACRWAELVEDPRLKQALRTRYL